jgi:hypothetical protein
MIAYVGDFRIINMAACVAEKTGFHLKNRRRRIQSRRRFFNDECEVLEMGLIMDRSTHILLVIMLLSLPLFAPASGDEIKDGTLCRLLLTNNTEIVGTVTVQADAYEVQVAYGIKQTIPKNQVRQIIALESGENSSSGSDASSNDQGVSAQEIQTILGTEPLEEMYVWDYVKPVDLMAPLPTDPDALREMLRIAGQGAKYLETDHFVLAYTTDMEKAKRLAARFEAVYKWRVWLAGFTGITPTVPEFKMQSFLFATHAEFNAYSTLHGDTAGGTLGFWHPIDNRSAYFDIETFPIIAQYLRRYADPNVDPQIRRRGKNMIDRWVEHYNYEVVQHEIGHHIDFNIGFFPQRGDVPRWLCEGLTMQFEVSPSQLGACFGKINYSRLNELRTQYGPNLEALPPLRDFMLHQALWFRGYNYPLGWALVHYLIKNYPDGFPKFMRLIAQREDEWGILVPLESKLSEMEELFGKLDGEWDRKFKEYINGIPMRQSELTPQLSDLP